MMLAQMVGKHRIWRQNLPIRGQNTMMIWHPQKSLPHYRDFWLEIGFGGGEHMVGQARAHPDIGIIGCDMFLNGLAQALTAY